MKFIFAVAACILLLLLAYQADTPDRTQDPHPMKHNQEQFSRMQPAYDKDSAK
ncbi:hypothetical protein [Paenibacillus qinlingensis]|uniref:Uncharacterized protein n=1 Tax=Paenibacillus qinlingensis TaxID=1837343 RepID=A0ABU1NZT6_9BACL|nr:hypothetical protein [Paenibacillus qinlingensis]MDR6552983.1 hypothetical protein [Paenibacillus qinlingensis]